MILKETIWRLVAVLFLAVLGCNAEAPGEAAPTSKTEAASTAVKVPRETAREELPGTMPFHPGRQGGIIGLLHRALKDVTLTEEQKAAVDKVHTPEATKPWQDYRAAKAAYYRTLASGLAAGKLNRPAAETALDRVRNALDAKHAAEVKMVADLHAMLTPEQRSEVKEAATHWLSTHGKGAGCPYAKKSGCPYLEAGGCPHAAAHPGCPMSGETGCLLEEGGDCDCPHAEAGGCPYAAAGDCPHAEAGGCPYAAAGGGGPHAKHGHGGHGRGDHSFGRFAPEGGRWLRGIPLTDDQQRAVDALDKNEETATPGASAKDRGAARNGRFMDAFAGFDQKTFDAAALKTETSTQEKLQLQYMTGEVDRLAALTGILDAGQLSQLKDNLEKKADRLSAKSGK